MCLDGTIVYRVCIVYSILYTVGVECAFGAGQEITEAMSTEVEGRARGQ